MTYSIKWKLWDVTLEGRHLIAWQNDALRKTARELLPEMDTSEPSQHGELTQLLAQELRDWVLRGGERFLPMPDVALDLYWKAHRGLPGFYDPLLLGLDSTKFLGGGSAGDIGEGVALAVFETEKKKKGLGQIAFCRPLGTSPDFLCCDPNAPSFRPIVEVKATENGSIKKMLTEAILSLLNIYRGWHHHRPLSLTPGYAVAVQVVPLPRSGEAASVA